MPKVTIILPAYNAAQTIRESIDSILGQTYKDWLLMVINDGSQDDTEKIACSYQDSRIQVLNNEQNRGITYTLNRGLALSSTPYIARMDADDIAYPEWLETIMAYMESHPKTIVCGSYVNVFGEGLATRLAPRPTEDKEIRQSYVILSPFHHPSVVMREEVKKVGYDSNYPYAEDYKLWWDLWDKGEFHNIPTPLIHYRISMAQTTRPTNEVQRQSDRRCKLLYMKRFLPDGLYQQAEEGITLDLIKRIPKDNPYLLTLLYHSLPNYSPKVLLHCFISGDWHRIGLKNTLRLGKRLVVKQMPLLAERNDR